jgi:hypothetical protein
MSTPYVDVRAPAYVRGWNVSARTQKRSLRASRLLLLCVFFIPFRIIIVESSNMSVLVFLIGHCIYIRACGPWPT